MATKVQSLLAEVRACRICEAHLPLGPRPVLRIARSAKIVIVGQAPGTRVHASGKPWDDPSGDHLREWLQLDEDVFYDEERVAIIPMGFCYPGKKGQGDAPPRPECAPTWHGKLIEALPKQQLIILCGQYALKYYLGPRRKRNLTETVRAFQEYLPDFFALPHPSWRSRIFRKQQLWFDADVLPELRARTRRLLNL